jgi:glucose/arabinose dehydrogenase
MREGWGRVCAVGVKSLRTAQKGARESNVKSRAKHEVRVAHPKVRAICRAILGRGDADCCRLELGAKTEGSEEAETMRVRSSTWIFAAAVIILGVFSIFVSRPTLSSASGRAANGTNGTVSDDSEVLKGSAAFGDAMSDHPGTRRLIRADDLPQPYATTSSDNGARLIARPTDAWPKAPDGFEVKLYTEGLDQPRKIITAPNGDLFVVESHANRITVFRGVDDKGQPQQKSVFSTGLKQPFGMAFYPNDGNPQYLYVGNTDSVVRFAYHNGDLKAQGKAQTIVNNIPAAGLLHGGGHWTRDVVFSKDGSKMFVAVGSHSNVSDDSLEKRRADILEFNTDGSAEQIYASGIRNPVGLAINPETGELWASVNERDELGDNLPPDYITTVKEGGFYGWPWYYIGSNEDPRHKGARPDLKGKVTVPDVLLQAHSASLCITFYNGTQFPQDFRGEVIAAEHGSWNRARRTGYKLIRVPAPGGKPTGEYDDFITGFVTQDGMVWGRPVGVTVAKDGSLFFTDDGSNSVWHVIYTGVKK